MPVNPPPITTAGSLTCRLAKLVFLAAPVNCKAIRKSLAWRMPGAMLPGMGKAFGNPAPTATAK